MEDCFIFQKHAGNIQTAGTVIYEDDILYVGHIDQARKPSYLDHIMIDLKRHVPTLGDMTIEEAQAFGVMMARVSNALMKSENAEHVYSLVSGNSVPHLHMHIVPRYPNTPKPYWGPLDVYKWEDAPMGNNDEVTALCLRIKIYLENQYYG